MTLAVSNDLCPLLTTLSKIDSKNEDNSFGNLITVSFLMKTILNVSRICRNCNKLIKRQSCHHIETSQLIIDWFYMMATLAFNELIQMKNSFRTL